MALNQVPLPGQSLAVTQEPINTNFFVINRAFEVDHVTYNSALNVEGKHNKVTFIRQGAPPVPLTTEMVVYNANSALSGQSELFVNRLAGTPVPFTLRVVASLNRQYTYLPSGMSIQFGNSASAGTTITYPRGFNDTSYTLQITPRLLSGAGVLGLAAAVTDKQAGNFTYVINQPAGTTYGIDWVAIGVGP